MFLTASYISKYFNFANIYPKEDFATEISLRQRCQSKVCNAFMCGIMSFI